MLIVESARLMTELYQKMLRDLPLQLTNEDNGLTALERLLHEPYDLLIVGRELKELNGIALMAALRSVINGSDSNGTYLSDFQGNLPPLEGEGINFSPYERFLRLTECHESLTPLIAH